MKISEMIKSLESAKAVMGDYDLRIQISVSKNEWDDGRLATAIGKPKTMEGCNDVLTLYFDGELNFELDELKEAKKKANRILKKMLKMFKIIEKELK